MGDGAAELLFFCLKLYNGGNSESTINGTPMNGVNTSNPRNSNGHARRTLRERVKRMGEPCWICGRPIDYELTTWTDPRDGKVKRHPYSFEVDEVVPVSRYMEGGYQSAQACALDPKNVKAAHRICNQRRGNKSMGELVRRATTNTRKSAPKVEKRSREW